MELDILVAKLRMLKADHQSQHYRLEDSLLKTFPQQIASFTERIAGIEKDIETYNAEHAKCVDVQTNLTGSASAQTKFAGMTIGGVHYTEKEPAAKALLEICKGVTDMGEKAVGEYMGFKLAIRYDSFTKQMQLLLRGAMTYITELGTDTFGNITRINNCLEKLPERLEGAKAQLAETNRQIEAAKLELEKPFPQEAELQEKEARLALLTADLNIDGEGDFDIENDTESRDDSEQDISDADEDVLDENGEDDEPQKPFHLQNPGVTITLGAAKDGVRQSEQRTGTYGKSRPSILDGIRNFDSGKFNNAPKPPNEQRGVTERS